MVIKCDVCGKTLDIQRDEDHFDVCPEQFLGPIVEGEKYTLGPHFDRDGFLFSVIHRCVEAGNKASRQGRFSDAKAARDFARECRFLRARGGAIPPHYFVWNEEDFVQMGGRVREKS